MNIPDTPITEEIQKRFLSYVTYHTTSDRHQEGIPSTETQWNFAKALVEELKNIGITDITLNEHCYIIARLPARGVGGKNVPPLGFMAHMDTSEDAPGKEVKPHVHKNYNGGKIELKGGTVIDPAQSPDLAQYKDHSIITSDGTTLLGADNKAGIAEILTAVNYIHNKTDIPHGELEIVFTPDEETGKGMDKFPVELLNSPYCFTVDGDAEGVIEAECFNAYQVNVDFTGKVIHLGKARGQLVNAVSMAASFVTMLPAQESPEATDEKYGYYAPLEINGSLDSAHVEVFLRDFELNQVKRRIEAMRSFAAAVEAQYPGGTVTVTPQKQYLNMREYLKEAPHVLKTAEEAIKNVGLSPYYLSIRGGTDGARLSEMGKPTPNLFTGGHNFHSKTEWIAVPAMARAAKMVAEIIRLWPEKSK